MKRVLLSLALCAFSVMALAVEEEITSVEGMDKEIFVQSFPIEGQEGQAKLFLYSKRELDLVWIKIQEKFESAVLVPVTGTKLFGYRFPGEVDVAKIEKIVVRAWDVSTKRRIRSVYEAKLADQEVTFSLSSYGYFTQKEVPLDVQLTETAPGSGQFYVTMLSAQELSKIVVWDGKQWAQARTLDRNNKIFHAYRTFHTISKEAGVNVDIKAKLALDGSGFTDKFVLRGTSEALAFELNTHTLLTQEQVQLAEREEQARIQQQLLSSVQGVAQARANQMAINMFMPSDHNIAGAPAYPPGLFEGIGTGGPGCATCHGPDYGFNGGVVADASAVGANGMTYRVRFYSP